MPLTDDEIYVLWCKRLGGSGLWPKSGGPVPLSAALVAGIRSAMREAYDRACEQLALKFDETGERNAARICRDEKGVSYDSA